MPRKNKRTKPANETKPTDEKENTLSLVDHTEDELTVEKPEKKSLLLSLDKKLKLQVKKQKKKERKQEFESGNKKIPKEMSVVPHSELQSTPELREVDKEQGTPVEDIVYTSQAEVIADTNLNTTAMSEEEEKNLREFLKTLDIVQEKATKEVEKTVEAQIVKNKFHIETIPEDMFEEFIENQEMVQARDAIRTFPRTSPLHSPKSRRKEPTITEAVVHPSPKICYNFHGMPYTASTEKSFSEDDFDEGIVIINIYRNKEQEGYSRRLDVILEESSDMSDTSGQSEKKSRTAAERGRNGPREVLRPFPLKRERKDGTALNIADDGDSCNVQPVVIENLKMSDDDVKIELDESESEGDFNINQHDVPYSVGEAEIINLKDENGDCAKSSFIESGKDEDKETSSSSVKAASGDFYKVEEEEWESWRSSLNPDGFCDGTEADVESELDSQKALVLGPANEFKMSDVSNDKDVEIFSTNVKEMWGVTVKADSRDSWNPAKKLPQEVDDVDLLQRSVILRTYQMKHSDAEDEADHSELELGPEAGKAIRTGVSVKDLSEALKNDMDKILFTKIKVIKYAEEAQFRESSWMNALKETKDQLEYKNNSSTDLNLKWSGESTSTFSENPPKYEKIIRMVRTAPEKRQNPEALSNLAEKKVLALPYGRMLLRKIGLSSCCSKDSDSGKEVEEVAYETSSLEPDSPCFIKSEIEDYEDYEELEEDRRSYIEFDYYYPKVGETEKWYGLRTPLPAVLVGLSPSQKKVYEGKKKRWLPDAEEAANLLDLHRKFIERRSYNEASTWSRERNIVYDSMADKKSVFITEISREFENMEKSDKAKEGKITKGNVPSPDNSEYLPEKTVLRLVGNKKSHTEDDVLKSKCCSIKDDEKGSNGSRAGEKEGETNVQTEKDCEVVGKSRLLAILQNAISDDFAPELNTDCSIKSSCENHEVSVVPSQKNKMEERRYKEQFKRTAKHDAGVENSVRRNQKTFQDFWNKEKTYCSSENDRHRIIPRPKTICCENESELYLDGPGFEKEVHALKNVPVEEKEELIITENLPAVSEIIKSFEEPKISRPPGEYIERKNKKTEIRIDNERYQISQKGDIALLQSDPLEGKKMQKEKRRSMPASILSEKEIFKQKMYDEYMSKLAERIGRRQQKVIKLSQSNEIECPEESKFLDLKNEFFSKVKEREEKLGIIESGSSQKEFCDSLKESCQEFRNYWEGEIFNLENERRFRDREDVGGTESTNSKRSSIQLLDTSTDLENLPKHLKELLQVEEEEFPDFFDDFLRLKPKGGECCRCKLRKNNLLKEIDEELVFSKGFLFGRGKSFENMPSSILFSPTFKATAPRPGVWSPAFTVSEEKTEEREENEERKKLENEPIPPVWTPKSAQASPVLERKEFRPVNFESPTLPRKKYIQDDNKESSVPPPWQQPGGDKLPQLVKSPSSPALSLPRAPNPTVTLLQKAREGHLPRGAHYLNIDMNESPASDGTTIERLQIVSSTKSEPNRPQRAETGPKKIIGIGPTTKEGIPLVLRSEVTEENKEKWYKRMYDSLHKYGKDDDYVTVKYRTSPRRKGLYNYQHGSGSGYQSEPESLSYDLSNNKYVTLDRRRNEKSQEKDSLTLTLPRSRTSPPRRDFREYKNQPGRIEDYEPGHSSISELEANKWWDEVLEIFDKWLDRSPNQDSASCNSLLLDAIQLRNEEEKSRPVLRKSQSPRSFINYASGYISDPQYVYKRTEEDLQSPPSSEEQKEAYRIIQKGGEIPLRGLRKPAPERPKDSINTEIEYFPLSPTLTRIRVHKQNITPLSERPFPLYPLPYDSATLNFPPLPFGVCSSFSQVQLFPPPVLPQLTNRGLGGLEASQGKDQKFSVQLQNISGPEDYVQIVPKPRSLLKKSPIYANIPVRKRSCSPVSGSFKRETNKKLAPETGASVSAKKITDSAVSVEGGSEKEGPKLGKFATFSDLKRIAPSINSATISNIPLNKIPTKQRKTDSPKEKSKESSKKKDFLISKLAAKSPTRGKKTSPENKENCSEKTKIPTEKGLKKEKKKAEPKAKEIATKRVKTKIPLSESIQREKPLAKSSKRLKTVSDILKTKKIETKSTQKDFAQLNISSSGNKKDVIECLTRFSEYSNSNSVDLKSPEVRTVSFLENKEKDASMSPVYATVEQKPKIDSDITEVFRSRSFSPDVKRKIFKFPDMNKPLPPKRKESKMSPTLKLWSKMMLSYPRHKSRLESFDSNVKFLGDRIKRKLADEKDSKLDFRDNVETVRTVRKDKNGELRIKTNRYLKLAKPVKNDLMSARATYPDIERRKLISEPRPKFGSVDSIQPRKYSDASTISKPITSDLRKSAKRLDTVLRSSTTYSVRNPAREDDDKRKSVKVTVAISSKGKELSRKKVNAPSPVRKAVSKGSSSPCPSVSSFRSGVSGKSDKGSVSSQERIQSPQAQLISPNSSTSRLSNISRSTSPGSAISKPKIMKQTFKKLNTPPIVVNNETKPETKTVTREIGETVTKSPRKPPLSEKMSEAKEEAKKTVKKSEGGKIKTIVHKKTPQISSEETNEVIRGRDLVRTDSFFQNLFLRGLVEKRPVEDLERTTSVLERAQRYQRRLDRPETYKSEPSLSLVTYYLNQKRPVSFSKFKNWDRSVIPPGWPSPLGSLHSDSFQVKLRRFDSISQFGDGLRRDFSPELKERSLSEPPTHRSHTISPDQKPDGKSSRVSLSEASSMRSSPTSSRSPSCRRIHNYRSSQRATAVDLDVRKMISRARSSGEIEELKSRRGLQCGDLGKSSSSLNLSNLSDHTEYQAYVLELMHSSRKCERFRELHKFYSNLERMGKLERTASTGDLRPRLRNEEIIDFDRWKKIRTKERAEAELKALMDSLVKVQKEKDLLFRASDVEAVRWKGDSGLRIKERSVEDLREQFSKYSEENLDPHAWRKKVELRKDNYKPLWRGSSIVDVASNLNNTLISHRGRPITLQELEKLDKSKTRIGKEYGYSLKAWSSLSNEQINALKDQLNQIYAQDTRKKELDGSLEDFPDRYEMIIPKGSDIRSPGESSLQVRCSSALSKSQTYTPTVRRKEELRKELKKADSIGILPTSGDISAPQLLWKDDTKIGRSHSEGRSEKHDRYPLLRSKSTSSSKPLSENEKKLLSTTLSKEVIEKMTKAGGKGPLFPRETLGALAAVGSKLRDYGLAEGTDRFLEEWSNDKDESGSKDGRQAKGQESGSGSSEASIKTVIRKNSVDVLKKVELFEDMKQSTDNFLGSDIDFVESQKKTIDTHNSKKRKEGRSSTGKKKNTLIASSSMENLNDFFGLQKHYTTSPVLSKPTAKPASHTLGDASKALVQTLPRAEDFYDSRHIFEGKKWPSLRYHSTSPVALRSGSSSDSLFSCRSRSVSPDPTKYYRAYLRMVKCGAVRKLCNKFESWEDLLSMSSDRDFWLPPPPRRFASDPELTRDLLKRFGTDPTKVTIRGQEVGDVRWLRTKFEKDLYPPRGRSRFRRGRSPLLRSPLTVADRFMPRINVISKTAELQMQGLERKQKNLPPSKAPVLAAPPENYRSLIDYTKDHGGYYYTGEVEKLRRKFERLSILGQMYTSAPNVNELRDIAPYLECSWLAHRYPGVSKTTSSPELLARRQESPKKPEMKSRPHSSSPVRPKQISSILKPSCAYPDRFANQKFDPSIHRPKYRYQPEREVDHRYKRGDPDWWRHWNKPTVTFKESVSFKSEPEIRDLSPESPRKYVESEVTIHYKSPVRSEAKGVLSEDELARRQAESMKRIYKEERRRKYLQELQDMNSRRHTDNFIPSQKSPISLNRYDDFPAEGNAYYRREYSVDPVLVARGLYDFVGRRPRELGFRRGDIIFIIRKLDKNWCEGELNGVVGLFPLSYVEVIPYSEINLKYGRARAKYDFIPQTPLELMARKGDMITLLRKIDENWFEGRIGERTGIIPASYCLVLAMPQTTRLQPRVEKSVSKPVASPAAHSLIHNGSGLASKHYYTPYLSPSSPGRSTTSSTSVSYHPSADMLIDEALLQLDEEFGLKKSSKLASQPLNVRINPRPEPELYQVLFNHVPNNDDELELVQGETVTVVEKCGDGWYIGSKSDGKLGIFPGTHVRRIGPEFV